MGNFLDSIIKPVPHIKHGMEFPLDGLGDIPEQNMEQQQFIQDPLGVGGLPPMSSYGAVQPSFNEKIAELAIGTSIKIGGEPISNINQLPVLFYFLTDNWRHFQLSMLKKNDQRDIERRIKYIHFLAGRDRYQSICKLKQIELFNKIYLYKSRCDTNDPRERLIWTLQTNNMQQQEIKRPRESGGGGFMSFFTGKSRSVE